MFVVSGTGTAPFRSFWQELDEIKSLDASFNVPKVWLFFGCRTKLLDLYSDEKESMLEKGILDKVFLALSREPKIPKVSPIDLITLPPTHLRVLTFNKFTDLCSRSDNEGSCGNLQLDKTPKAHIYVCGDVQMAENVYQTLR